MLKPELWRLIDKYSQAMIHHHNLSKQDYIPEDERESSLQYLSTIEDDINNFLHKMKYYKSKTQLVLTVLACVNCLILVYWGIYSGDIGLTGISGLYPLLIYLLKK